MRTVRDATGIGPAMERGLTRRDAAACRRTPTPLPGLGVCWITRRIRGKISWRPRVTRTRWGATRPLLDLAKRAMRNHPQTSNRHRFGFDLLEGRQLLSGGYFPAPQSEFVVITYGPPADSGGLSGHDARMDDSGPSAPIDSPAWGGPGAGMYDRGGDADQGAMARMDGSAAAPAGGVNSTAASAQSSPTAPGSTSPAQTGSSLTTPPADSPSGAAGMTPAGSYGSPGGAATLAPGDAAVPGSPQAMLPSMNLPAVPPGESPAPFGPGGFEIPSRYEDAAPSFFLTFSSPALPAGPAAMARGPFEIVGSPSGTTSTTASPNGPGVQALSSQATSLVASTVVAGPAMQSVTGATTLPIQTAAMTDSDSPRADHPASAVGSGTRPERAARSSRVDRITRSAVPSWRPLSRIRACHRPAIRTRP